MKTLWSRTRWIENFLFRQARNISASTHLLDIIPGLKEELVLQVKVYHFIRLYHRKKRRQEVRAIGLDLLSDPGKRDFQHKVSQIFK